MAELNKKPGPDIKSNEEFPDLKPSKGKRQVQPRTSTSRREMQGLGEQTKPVGINLNKEHHIPSPHQETEMTE